MGVDFLEGKTKSFKKRWDRKRCELATPDFFTRQPGCAVPSVLADILEGHPLGKGMSVLVQLLPGERLVVFVGNEQVGLVIKPSEALLRAIREGYGYAKGTVDELHPMSHTAEISLC